MNKNVQYLSKKLLVYALCFALLMTSGILTSLVVVEASVINPPAREMPSTFSEANDELPERLGTMIEYMVQLTLNEPYDYSDTGKAYFGNNHIEKDVSVSFSKMLAMLMSMKIWNNSNPNLKNIYNLATDVQSVQPQIVNIIENWIAGINVDQGIGTSKDYNMKWKEIIAALYMLRDSQDSVYLTNDAAYNLIKKCFVDKGYYGTSNSHMVNDYYVVDNPETENHVLMIYSGLYLVNQYVTKNYRNDPRLRQGVFANYQTAFCNTIEFEEFLLNILQRSVYSDFFEFNSRPYLHHSLLPIFNLAVFADSPRIRQAAKNALDAIAAKFAFTTLEGKTYGPARRSSNDDKYLYNIGLYKGSGTMSIFAMLSGAYAWSDYFQSWNQDKDTYGYLFKEYYSYTMIAGILSDPALVGGYGYAYRIPKQIHQFFLDKRDGYWARFMPRYGDDYRWEWSYGEGDNRWANYFDEDGVRIINDMRYTPEAYFVTNDFIHSMGGHFDDQPYDDGVNTGHFYHGLTKYTTLIPKGDISDWGSVINNGNGYENMADDIFLMKNKEGDFFRQDLTGTFKNFSCTWKSIDGILPISTPDRFVSNSSNYREFYSVNNAGDKKIWYKLYDLTSYAENCYFVVGFLYDNNLSPGQVYKQFWEILPEFMFENIEDLKLRHIDLLNNAQNFFHSDSSTYKYTLVSGEQVYLNKNFGYQAIQPIEYVKNKLGTTYNNYEYYYNNGGYELHPLMDVREVNMRYEFTGRKLAYSRGDGLIQIYNPSSIVGNDKYYIIDSRNIYAPYSMSSTESQMDMNGLTYQNNKDYQGVAITIRTANESADGDPGTTNLCKLQIGYENGEEVSYKTLDIPRTNAGNSTTLYYYPPAGELYKIKSLKLQKYLSNTNGSPASDDPWFVESIAVEYKGQTVMSRLLYESLTNYGGVNPCIENMLEPSEKLGGMHILVKTKNETNAGTLDNVYFRVKLKDNTIHEYFVSSNLPKGEYVSAYLDRIDFPLDQIKEVGFRKQYNINNPQQDNWKLEAFYLKTQDINLYNKTADVWLSNPVGPDSYATFNVNYTNAPYQDKISEPVGKLRVHLRQNEDDGIFDDPKSNDKFYLKIGYADGSMQSTLLIPRYGFNGYRVFEDSNKDYMTSVIFSRPRHMVTYLELYKEGTDGFGARYFRMWLDDRLVFSKGEFGMGNNATKHWDVNGL